MAQWPSRRRRERIVGKTCIVSDAVADIPEGSTLMIGGFMGVGTPGRLIDELVRQRKEGLCIISNDNGAARVGIGKPKRKRSYPSALSHPTMS